MGLSSTPSWILLTRLLLILICAPVTQAAPYRLGLGVYSSQKPKDAAAHFLPFTKALQTALSQRFEQPVEVYLSVMRTYEDGERFIQEGDVDFLELGAANYVLARKKNPDLEVLAVRSPSDANLLGGVICVRSNSNIATVQDLKGRSIAFGNSRSTTGHFLSQQHLVELGILAKDFAKQTHLGSHREVAAAVASGQYDAGALNMIEFEQALRNGHRLRILSRFRNFGRPWVCRSALPAKLKQALKQSLLEVPHVPSIGASGDASTTMLPADDGYFNGLREAMKTDGVFSGKRIP
jgi:phosphonate transport system substrate-binding protein